VKVTQASRSLIGAVTALERSARQYAVAGEATFLQAYRNHRETFAALVRQLDHGSLSESQRVELAAIRTQEESIHELIGRAKPSPDLSSRLQKEFAVLSDRAQSLVRLGDQVIDEGIELLRNEAVKSRNNVFWLVIALIPTAILLIAAFTFLIARPISQVSASIKGLGEGEFAKPIRIHGP